MDKPQILCLKCPHINTNNKDYYCEMLRRVIKTLKTVCDYYPIQNNMEQKEINKKWLY